MLMRYKRIRQGFKGLQLGSIEGKKLVSEEKPQTKRRFWNDYEEVLHVHRKAFRVCNLEFDSH